MSLLISAACTTFETPLTQGDPAAVVAYGYTPLDPLPINLKIPMNYRPTNQDLLDMMPDETMRLGIGTLSASGAVSFGPASAGYAGNSYVVVLDYTKCTTSQIGLQRVEVDGKAVYSLARFALDAPAPNVILPVYVGVGLRLTATITIMEGSVELSNLLALGAAVEAKRASGTLVIQTLGLSGEGISTAIPIPSELNETTIQNALMAMGAVKAKTYDQKTLVTPRVVGFYNSVGGGKDAVNGLISCLLEEPIPVELPLRPMLQDESGPIGERPPPDENNQ